MDNDSRIDHLGHEIPNTAPAAHPSRMCYPPSSCAQWSDAPLIGSIAAQLITDPDAHQTSFQHFSLTGENWIGTTCYPDGADIQGGDL